MIKVADLNGQTWDQSPPQDSGRSKCVELGLKSQKRTQGSTGEGVLNKMDEALKTRGRGVVSGGDKIRVRCRRLRWICIGWAGFELHSPG